MVTRNLNGCRHHVGSCTLVRAFFSDDASSAYTCTKYRLSILQNRIRFAHVFYCHLFTCCLSSVISASVVFFHRSISSCMHNALRTDRSGLETLTHTTHLPSFVVVVIYTDHWVVRTFCITGKDKRNRPRGRSSKDSRKAGFST